MSVSLQNMQHTEQQESIRSSGSVSTASSLLSEQRTEVWTIATPLLELVLLLFDPLTVKQEG